MHDCDGDQRSEGEVAEDRGTNGSRHGVDACSRCTTLINREATAMQLSRRRELRAYYKVRIGDPERGEGGRTRNARRRGGRL